MVMASHSVA
ncbi:hypothetical protein LINPERPRIM_LOCUS29716 [Linum perenne]